MPAPTVERFEAQIHDLEARLPSALHDPARAVAILPRLDEAERGFGDLSNGPRGNAPSIETYRRLDAVLRSVREHYLKLTEDCDSKRFARLSQEECGEAREVAKRTAFILGWLDYQAANYFYSDDPESAKRLLNEALALFSPSAAQTEDHNTTRENLLGRAYAEKDLGRFDRSEFEKAISDYKLIMKDGRDVSQYKAAQQGCANTYAMMGQVQMTCTGFQTTANFHGRGYEAGALMFKIQMHYAAMYAATDDSRRTDILRQIVSAARDSEKTPELWAISIASIAKYSRDPVAELGAASDPFQSHLLANVLRAKKDNAGAAKYFLIAARSGKYPQDLNSASSVLKASTPD